MISLVVPAPAIRGLVWLLCFPVAPAAALDGAMESFLRANAGLNDRELSLARAGEVLVKTPDTGIDREMVSVGVTRFQIPPGYYLERVRQATLYRPGQNNLQLGRFSSEPSVEDLKGLTLAKDDLAALADFDREAARSESAARLFLVRLVRSYQAAGIQSLDALKPGSNRPSLAAEARSLLANSPYLRFIGDGVETCIAAYPLARPCESQDYFMWAKVHIGLKRLIRITRVSVWTIPGDPPSAAVVTQQVFASRYFQASLQVDFVIPAGSGAPSPQMFLVTVNRGRCALLDSFAARLLRPLILNRTRASTQSALGRAKISLEREYSLSLSVRRPPQLASPSALHHNKSASPACGKRTYSPSPFSAPWWESCSAPSFS